MTRKNIKHYNPSAQDLRQMYVYNDYWKDDSKPANSILLYPTTAETKLPDYKQFVERKHFCAIGKLNILNDQSLDPKIGHEILEEWLQIS